MLKVSVLKTKIRHSGVSYTIVKVENSINYQVFCFEVKNRLSKNPNNILQLVFENAQNQEGSYINLGWIHQAIVFAVENDDGIEIEDYFFMWDSTKIKEAMNYYWSVYSLLG